MDISTLTKYLSHMLKHSSGMLQCFTMHHKLELGCHLCGRESWHGGTPQIFAYVQIFAYMQICVNICICANICTYMHVCEGKLTRWHSPGEQVPLPGEEVSQGTPCLRICLCICFLYLSLYLYSVFVFVSLYFHLKMPFNIISTHTEYLCNVSSGFVTPEREKPRLFVISAHKDGFVTAGLVTATCQLARC